MKTRADVRGKRLHPDCVRAKRTTHEFPNDDRVFCYGLYEVPYIMRQMCIDCAAYVWNAEPPKED